METTNTSVNNRLNMLENMMDSIPEGKFIDVEKLSNSKQEFIGAIKFLIDCGKPYEFNGNYTKVRRLNNDTSNFTTKQKSEPARSEA